MKEFAELAPETHQCRSRLMRVMHRQLTLQIHKIRRTRHDQESDIHLYVPKWSQGLRVDACVITEAAQTLGLRQASIELPASIYQVSEARALEMLKVRSYAPAAIFIERLFPHPDLKRYLRRIFIPNPEHLDSQSLRFANTVTEVWHKTRFSLIRLEKLFPKAVHRYLGFTSPRPMGRACDYRLFCHLRGKSPHRHTQLLLDLWSQHSHWPILHMHLYGSDMAEVSAPRLRDNRNIRLRTGYLENHEYFDVARRCGVHLCPSEVEGFGHYINEARALGAVPVVLDAPPMNELVDRESGFLIATCDSSADHQGMRFKTDRYAMAMAIESVLDTSKAKLAEIGQRALCRYEAERTNFYENFNRAWVGFEIESLVRPR